MRYTKVIYDKDGRPLIYTPPRSKTPKSSSGSAGGRRKTWLSLRDVVSNGRDISPRLGFAWWKSPMMKEARLRKAASLRG